MRRVDGDVEAPRRVHRGAREPGLLDADEPFVAGREDGRVVDGDGAQVSRLMVDHLEARHATAEAADAFAAAPARASRATDATRAAARGGFSRLTSCASCPSDAGAGAASADRPCARRSDGVLAARHDRDRDDPKPSSMHAPQRSGARAMHNRDGAICSSPQGEARLVQMGPDNPTRR
jgi:hypothetical protein